MDLKKFDMNALKRYTNSQALKDFDVFLDAIPVNVGYNALMLLGMIWAVAIAAVLFTSVELDKIATMNKELKEVEALQPPIPVLEYVPVEQGTLKAFSKNVSDTYQGIIITQRGSGEVMLTAQDTDYFPQFIASISYFQRGAKNWKVTTKAFCVGRDCTGSKLSANLKIEVVRIGEPAKNKDKEAK